jgi:ABC-type transport system involved in cytochrome bd biosynthesis fused ATPase/permease subunit
MAQRDTPGDAAHLDEPTEALDARAECALFS